MFVCCFDSFHGMDRSISSIYSIAIYTFHRRSFRLFIKCQTQRDALVVITIPPPKKKRGNQQEEKRELKSFVFQKEINNPAERIEISN